MRVVPFRVHLCTRVYAGAASRGTYVHMKASPLIASICSLAPMPRHSITKEPKPASRTNGHTIPVNYLHTRLSLLHFSVLDGVSSKKKTCDALQNISAILPRCEAQFQRIFLRV